MDKQINGFLYVDMEKVMYWLVQAIIIEHTDLKEHLCPFIYEPATINPGLWLRNINGINFTLVVNEFGIRYQRREETLCLINTL